MHRRIVNFLSFEGCPLAPKALAALEAALETLPSKLNFRIEHIDLLDPATPEALRRWGSPIILFDGKDITGANPGDANSCRIYSSPGGVPGSREIAEALLQRIGD